MADVETIKAIPSHSGNGFTAGKVYTFVSDERSVVFDDKYQGLLTLNDNGHARFVSRSQFEPMAPACAHTSRYSSITGRVMSKGTWEVLN